MRLVIRPDRARPLADRDDQQRVRLVTVSSCPRKNDSSSAAAALLKSHDGAHSSKPAYAHRWMSLRPTGLAPGPVRSHQP